MPLARAAFALKAGVSYCDVDGRTVFLDTVADRYQCLSPAGERAFTRLTRGERLETSDIAALANLARNGPLVSTNSSSPIEPCRSLEIPACSNLDDDGVRPSMAATVEAAWSLLTARARLRLRGLHHVLESLDRRKRRNRGGVGSHEQACLAAAFARLRLFATEQDQCLPRSVAVADRLIATGARPELVIAVKLQPFYAHAWVQCDGWLVNDRHEFVRSYTPILII